MKKRDELGREFYVFLSEGGRGGYLEYKDGDQTLSFALGVWPHENAKEIQKELHGAVAPIIDRISEKRFGFRRDSTPIFEELIDAPTPPIKKAYRRS